MALGLYHTDLQPGIRHSLWPVAFDLAETPRIQLVGAGEVVGFVFAVDLSRYPQARMTARFTDDAGLHWQINHPGFPRGYSIK
jgi:hypothetical protein